METTYLVFQIDPSDGETFILYEGTDAQEADRIYNEKVEWTKGPHPWRIILASFIKSNF